MVSITRSLVAAVIVVGAVTSLAAAQTSRVPPAPPPTVSHPLDRLPVAARVRVDSEPDWKASAPGVLWVTTYRPGALHRIDTRTNRVTARVIIGRDPCLGLALVGNAVWVPACGDAALVAVDTGTLRVRRRLPLPLDPNREGFMAAAGGSLWVPVRLAPDDSLSRGLARVDAMTARVVATIELRGGSTTVASGFGSVWVAESGVDSVARVDPGTNKVVARVKVGGQPKFIAVGFGSLWVQNRADGSISRVDPRTNREVARIATGSPTRAGDLAAGGGAVWYSVDGAPVIRIDPSTNRVTHAYVGGSGADAIRVGQGAIWVADHEHHRVWRVPVAAFGDRSSAQPRVPPKP
jgi:YVTN family beta-propeller protein